MTTQQETLSTGGTSGHRYPISNLAYDLCTIIHEKAKGLEAYDTYMKDAQGNQEVTQILQQIRQQDTQFVQQLFQCVQKIQSGS